MLGSVVECIPVHGYVQVSEVSNGGKSYRMTKGYKDIYKDIYLGLVHRCIG